MLKEAYISKYELHKNTTTQERVEVIRSLIQSRCPDSEIKDNNDMILLNNINNEDESVIDYAVSKLYTNLSVPVSLLYNKFQISNNCFMIKI